MLVRGEDAQDLGVGGLVLGVDPQAKYEIETVQLQDGDALLFYTDGLIDAMNFGGELWGRERMIDAAQRYTDCPAKHMVKNILGFRRRFVGLARQIDDTSIIAIKVGPPHRTEGCSECECEMSEDGPSVGEDARG